MRKQAAFVEEVKSIFGAFVEFAKILRKLSQLLDKLKSAKDEPQLIQEIAALVNELFEIKAWEKISKLYEFVKAKLTKKSSRQMALVKLANELDAAGLFCEAEAVDLVLKKEAVFPVLVVLKGLWELYAAYKLFRSLKDDLQKFLSELAKIDKNDFKKQKDYVLHVIGMFVKTFAKRGLIELVSSQMPGMVDVLERLEGSA